MDLFDIKDRGVKTQALESAYDSGFTGCFLPTDSGPEGAQARYYNDEFRDVAGRNGYLFSAGPPLKAAGRNGVEGCHVYTSYAIDESRKHNRHPDTTYRMLQNSGNCVGASWKELMDCLLGVLSFDSASPYRLLANCSMVVYSYRSGCGQGWYMSACATQAKKYGWLPATVFDGRKLGQLVVPNYQNLQSDDENEFERLATSVWCNSRVPNVIEQWMAQNFTYDNEAITRLPDSSESTLKGVCEQQGCFHHGSNYTAGTGGLNSVRRIGGHAQTGYGGDWSDQAIDWWKRQGITSCSKFNFPMLQGQTWGPGWSGDIANAKWPYGSTASGQVITQADVNSASSDPNRLADLLKSIEGHWGWGPKPEGSWVVTRETFARYFGSECFVYLPKFRGIPSDAPVPPPPPAPSDITLTCEGLRPDIWSPMRGSLLVKAGGKEQRFILVPDGSGGYKSMPMQS